MAHTLAPPFPYFGGKQMIADQIVALMPRHTHYIEPFCGGLSVLLAKAPSKLETINDLDGEIMTFWRMLRDHPEDLARVCALTPHSRAEHQLSRVREDLTDLERARRVWVALTQGRAGQLRRTGWRYYVTGTSAPTIGMPGYLDGYVERTAAAAERLHAVSLECKPALEIIDAYGHDDTHLLYVDPPYLGDTRGTTHAYRHEMRAETEHRELAAALSNVKAAVMLSGYHSPLYDDLYGDWWRHEIAASTSQGPTKSESRDNRRTEVLWSNRPLAVAQTLDFGEAS